MKKKIIYSTAFTAMLTASAVFAGGPEIIPVQEDYFSGFYVGGTGGANQASFSANNSIYTSGDIGGAPTALLPVTIGLIPAGTVLASNDANNGGFTGVGGIQGGFNMTFNHSWVVGIEGFGLWGTQSQDSQSNTAGPVTTVAGTFGALPGPSTLTLNNTSNSNTVVELGNQYGVAGKLGYVFTPTTMLYAKIGAVWADLSVSNYTSTSTSAVITSNATGAVQASGNAITGASPNTTENKVALLLGAGFEQFVYQDIVSFDLEYDYANYGSVEASALAATTTAAGTASVPVTVSTSASVKVSTFLAGLNFYFGRNWF